MLEGNLGFLELIARNLEKVPEHYKPALEIRKKMPQAYGDILMSISLIAQAYSYRGELQKMEKMVEEGKKLLPLSQSDLTNEFFLTCVWGRLLLAKSDFEEALNVVEQALELKKKILNFWPSEPLIFFLKPKFLQNWDVVRIVFTYWIKQIKRLKYFMQKESKKQILRLGLWSSRLLILLEMGSKTTDPIAFVEESLDIYEKNLQGKKKDVWQGFAHFVLAKLYEQQGNIQKAIQTYRESEAVYDAVLKEKGIDDVADFGGALGLKSKDMTLVQTHLRRHTDTFGRNHPRTIEVIEYTDKNGIPVPY